MLWFQWRYDKFTIDLSSGCHPSLITPRSYQHADTFADIHKKNAHKYLSLGLILFVWISFLPLGRAFQRTRAVKKQFLPSPQTMESSHCIHLITPYIHFLKSGHYEPVVDNYYYGYLRLTFPRNSIKKNWWSLFKRLSALSWILFTWLFNFWLRNIQLNGQ